MATQIAPEQQDLAGAPSVRSRGARQRRALGVTATLAMIAFALFVATMMIGEYAVLPWDVIASVFHLRDDPGTDFVVRDLRLPNAATALSVGMAFGVSGAIFQRMLGNPLASPDLVGVSSGASMFAVSSIVLLNLGGVLISVAALVGALVAALTVYLLAWRGGVAGYRFILIGIAVSQFCLAVIGYVLSRADVTDARIAMTWLTGSVGQAGTVELRIVMIAVLVMLPTTLLLARQLGVLELGDDAAKALGVRVETGRLAMLLVAVVLVALATATAGPLAFVALISGPIAARLVGGGAPGLVAAAFVGAIVVLSADLVAQHVLPGSLPTGVVTGAVGGPYLIWLLATVNREGRGG